MKENNYMPEGMTYGMLAGSVVMSLLSMFDLTVWGGMAVGIGMIIGMLIGMNIKKG